MADSGNKAFTEPVLQAVAACLIRYAGRGQSVVVGYSGGLDSTVLLEAASRVAKDVGLDLSALHVHHGLSANADDWADSCRHVCHEMRIPLTILRVDLAMGKGEGVEAAARRVRHNALADHPADWILLAHHADDQAETVLHNLLRGCGLRGAAAMSESRGRVLRPLLGLGRDSLLVYAQSRRLGWIEDESNAASRYTRNFLRNEILPRITSRFPRARAQLAAAACRFSEAESLLDDLASLDLGKRSPEFPLPLTLFRELSDTRARNLLRAMLKWHRVQPPDWRRLNEFVRQVRTSASDRHPRLDVPRYSLWCKSGGLYFKTLE